ncbi:MAG: GAF domain-containing protein [Armatimonadetes bacterium]|nr:GAF domain-containing protein [Armatimonadota bacterium]
MRKEVIAIVTDDLSCLTILKKSPLASEFVLKHTGQLPLSSDFLKKARADIVLIDTDFPEERGWDSLARLRGREPLPPVPVLLIGKNWDTENRIRAFHMGAEDLLQKPCNPEELLARARRILERRQLIEDLKKRIRDLEAELEAHTGLRVDWEKELEEMRACLATMDDPEAQLDFIVTGAVSLFDADTVSLCLREPDSEEMTCKYARGLPEEIVKKTRIRPGEGMAGQVARTGRPLFLEDSQLEGEESSDSKSRTARPRSSILLPIRARDGVRGVLNISTYLPKKLHSKHFQIAASVGMLTGQVIESGDLQRKIVNSALEAQQAFDSAKKMKDLLRHFVPSLVVDQMLDVTKTDLSERRTMEATVLFCDLRGFTGMAEEMESGEVFEMLNEYYKVMEAVFTQYSGTAIDLQGDAEMVLFGAPEPVECHALVATEAAIEMQYELERLREKRILEGKRNMEMGVGICSGQLTIGVIGGAGKKQFTAIGDTANTAARLQALSQELQSPILISHTTYEKVKEFIWVTELPPVTLKGKSQKVQAYRVNGFLEEQMLQEQLP